MVGVAAAVVGVLDAHVGQDRVAEGDRRAVEEAAIHCSGAASRCVPEQARVGACASCDGGGVKFQGFQLLIPTQQQRKQKKKKAWYQERWAEERQQSRWVTGE